MSILTDMEAALRDEMRARRAKRSLGFPEPSPVFLIGNTDAFAAAMVRRFGPGADLTTFLGVAVERGPGPGVRVEWRAGCS